MISITDIIQLLYYTLIIDLDILAMQRKYYKTMNVAQLVFSYVN